MADAENASSNAKKINSQCLMRIRRYADIAGTVAAMTESESVSMEFSFTSMLTVRDSCGILLPCEQILPCVAEFLRWAVGCQYMKGGLQFRRRW